MTRVPDPTSLHRRVIKIGGSLLSRPDWPADVKAWHSLEKPASDFIVIGGGAVVDAVRNTPPQQAQATVATHWHCVELMNQTHHFATLRCPDWTSIINIRELNAHVAINDYQVAGLVAPSAFYSPSQNADALPKSWATTSDSIAALLATQIDAKEIVLLKSCEIPPSDEPPELATKGIVDQAFPDAASGIPKITVQRLPIANKSEHR